MDIKREVKAMRMGAGASIIELLLAGHWQAAEVLARYWNIEQGMDMPTSERTLLLKLYAQTLKNET